MNLIEEEEKMPSRTTANNIQRKFFEDLSAIDELVITTKNEEFCSMNVHGSFELFDKQWQEAKYARDETMIALKENGPARIYGEPPVHFHIDWNEVRYVCIRPRRLELINADYEIVFCRERDTDSRIFWFYIREDYALHWFVTKWGRKWINLSEELLTNLAEAGIDKYEFSLS
jgi:hypothetical protein